MQKVVKYSNFAPENMAVTLEALRNSHIGLRAASRVYHLWKDKWWDIWKEKIIGCFSASVRNLLSIFYVSWKSKIFL